MTNKFLCKGFVVILFCLNIIYCKAQNNPIFKGGSGDGHSKAIITQAGDNIFGGGNGDGHASLQTSSITVDHIFKGGNGDGWNSLQTTNPTVDPIFKGGNGDGWFSLQTSRGNSDTIFQGGIGDGWFSKQKLPLNVDTIFNGGNGDGWFSMQRSPINRDTIFSGGAGDGWASTYKPMGPIPVTFLYFNAKKQGETAALLNWKTSQELNSAYFNVERSTDAVNFSYIGRVSAAGNSQVPVEYYFTDNNPVSGLNYYRLRQVDIDGHFVYTPSRLVRFDALDAGNVRYFPNPTNGILYIELTASMTKEDKVINISNAAGIVLNQFKLGTGTNQLLQVNLGRYPKGVYFVQVRTATVNSTQRVVLQ